MLAEDLGLLEAALPTDEDRVGGHVARRRAQPLVLERRRDLLRRAPEEIERPEQLDVGVADGAHRRERALGILRHRVTDRVGLEPDAVEFFRGSNRNAREHATRGRRAHRVEKVAPFHSALMGRLRNVGAQHAAPLHHTSTEFYRSPNVSASDILSA